MEINLISKNTITHNMKYIFAILFTISYLSIHAQAQKVAWFTDRSEAKSYATDNDDNILMVFAGSDWCRPCIKLKKDILESTEFNSYSKDRIVVLYLDFPSKKNNRLSKEATAHNEELAEKYNQSGVFPKIILLDKDMNKIKELKYEGQSTQDFISMLK